MSPIELSVVVETMNTPPGDYTELTATLRALLHQSLPPERVEVIVVTDDVRLPDLRQQIARESLPVRVIDGGGRHYYAQKNLGAHEARGRLVGFVDSDCLPVEAWAETVVHALQSENMTIAAVQGPVRTETTILGHAFEVAQHFAYFATNEASTSRWLTGNNCAFRRSEFIRDPFDEAPVFHGPEVRKAASILAAGRQIALMPGAATHHHLVPGWGPFLGDGLYWGYCFQQLAQDGDSRVSYARLFHRLGLLAPLALVPAKAFVDLRLLLSKRQSIEVGWLQLLPCALALIVHALPVGLGAAMVLRGRPFPSIPTSSNAHDTSAARGS